MVFWITDMPSLQYLGTLIMKNKSETSCVHLTWSDLVSIGRGPFSNDKQSPSAMLIARASETSEQERGETCRPQRSLFYFRERELLSNLALSSECKHTKGGQFRAWTQIHCRALQLWKKLHPSTINVRASRETGWYCACHWSIHKDWLCGFLDKVGMQGY